MQSGLGEKFVPLPTQWCIALPSRTCSPDAFKHSHHDIAVREHQTEETALHFLEFVPRSSMPYVSPPRCAPFLFFALIFSGYSVVARLQRLSGANVMWTSDVLAHFYQHTDVVRPFADVCNEVMVAVGLSCRYSNKFSKCRGWSMKWRTCP